MSDFFLPKVDGVLTEGVCFDIRKEGKGERRFGAPPLCEGQVALTLPHRIRVKPRAGAP